MRSAILPFAITQMEISRHGVTLSAIIGNNCPHTQESCGGRNKELGLLEKGALKSMPRALITGGAGFLGSHLCDRLLGEGFEVVEVSDYLHFRRLICLLSVQ